MQKKNHNFSNFIYIVEEILLRSWEVCNSKATTIISVIIKKKTYHYKDFTFCPPTHTCTLEQTSFIKSQTLIVVAITAETLGQTAVCESNATHSPLMKRVCQENIKQDFLSKKDFWSNMSFRRKKKQTFFIKSHEIFSMQEQKYKESTHITLLGSATSSASSYKLTYLHDFGHKSYTWAAGLI